MFANVSIVTAANRLHHPKCLFSLLHVLQQFMADLSPGHTLCLDCHHFDNRGYLQRPSCQLLQLPMLLQHENGMHSYL